MSIVLQTQVLSMPLRAEQHSSLGGPEPGPGTTKGAQTVTLPSSAEQFWVAAAVWVSAPRSRSTSMTARRKYLATAAIACYLSDGALV